MLDSFQTDATSITKYKVSKVVLKKNTVRQSVNDWIMLLLSDKRSDTQPSILDLLLLELY